MLSAGRLPIKLTARAWGFVLSTCDAACAPCLLLSLLAGCAPQRPDGKHGCKAEAGAAARGRKRECACWYCVPALVATPLLLLPQEAALEMATGKLLEQQAALDAIDNHMRTQVGCCCLTSCCRKSLKPGCVQQAAGMSRIVHGDAGCHSSRPCWLTVLQEAQLMSLTAQGP
jgi:hypothetical protein